ncbi:MAG: XdhC family protein [Actinomycetota bacterium]|nr:XdhC family protein [Actinomycetota bacterium]
MSRLDLAARASELRAKRVPFVLATVLRAEAPTSAKPGDSAVVLADGSIEGFVGGSCAQATVRAESLRSLAERRPRMVLIAPDAEAAPAAEGVVRVSNPCLSGGTLEMFLEPTLPAPLVRVYGESPIALALRQGAAALGFDAVQGDPAEPIAEETAAVVVATHGFDEEAVISEALRAGVAYIGLVASRKRAEGVLGAMDLGDAERSRVHSPAGLDIGAGSPGEIAVSILAEIISLRPRGEVPPAPEVAIDPVCHMEVAAVESSLHSEFEGRSYYFCARGCLKAFSADPTAYLGG